MPPAKARDKERDKDVESPKKDHKDRPRHRSSRSSRKVEKPSTPQDRSSRSSSPTSTRQRRSSVPVPEFQRTSSNSPRGSKGSLPYPSFSKAHSKEAVGSREQVAVKHSEKAAPKTKYPTPDPTDLSKEQDHGIKYEIRHSKSAAPPSPPETSVGHDVKPEKPRVDAAKGEHRWTDLQKAADELKRRLVGEAANSAEVEKQRHPHARPRKNDHGKVEAGSPKTSKPGTPSRLKPKPATVEDASSNASFRKASSSVRSASGKSEAPTVSTDSDATSIAPHQPNIQRPFTPLANRDSSPATEPDSPEPKTPINNDFPPSRKETPAYSINGDLALSTVDESPLPPPPPPAPSEMPAPKVDYLLQHGGLPQVVPRSLLAASVPKPLGQSPAAVNAQVEALFLPFNKVLDDYSKVIARSGSVAVATGYRSVARRLLDRVERVFARDLSAEACLCDLCQYNSRTEQELTDKRGVSWGEILEYVCGRQDLPQWPPFILVDNAGLGLGISPPGRATPMQQLDVDVPEEFREHYVRQSKKTKQSVDRWLESQPSEPSAPPQDVDDETLTFAMLTRLDPDQRPLFSSFLGVTPVPSRPASTSSIKSDTASILPPSSTLLQKTALALQRLYRLSTPPRDPECAMYLLTNPALHNVLATLAAVSDHEWDLLISGRFDGFLRSGADESTPIPSATPSILPSRGPSRVQPFNRMVTPSLPPSRGPTSTPSTNAASSSAASGAPVALDEETEIAVLAEVERDIYLGMEALEDAFEALHLKAETVRRTLRERGAGLAQANQSRNGSIDVRMATPASVAWESETDDGIADDNESLAPDDSASNVSRSRVRRPKRRTERRTPAPVEEEDEGQSEVGTRKHEVGRTGSKLGKWFGGG